LCWQTVEQQFNPALAIALTVGGNGRKDPATLKIQEKAGYFE